MDSEKKPPLIDFDQAFEDHSRTVFRAALSIVQDAALAEDITQETFLRLFSHIDLITDASLLRPWLIRVAINLARNSLRNRGRSENILHKHLDLNQRGVDDLLSTFDAAQRQPPPVLERITDVIESIRQLTLELINHLRDNSDDLQKLDPRLFEHLVAELLKSRGFSDVRLVGSNPMTSADIFASIYSEAVGSDVKFFVEVKRWKDRVGIEIIDKVLGALVGERDTFGWHVGMIVSVAGFKDFKKYTHERIRLKGLELRDKNDLLCWLKDYKRSSNGLWLPNQE